LKALREQNGKFREQNGRLTTKSPEKVPSYVRPMFHEDASLMVSRVPVRVGL
jgi:hypothetical protein